MSDNYIKFWADQEDKFNATNAQDNTLYFVTDTGEIYKGGHLIANKINKAKVDATNIGYGTCSTAADAVEKVVELNAASAGWELAVGSLITVKFTNTNSVASPKLKVGDNIAYPIYFNNAEYTSSSSYGGYKDRHITYQFNGTHWVFISWSYDSNTTYTNAALGQGYGTCATAAATVAKTASLSSYKLTTGGIVSIKFTYDVPASATLNINSAGAKSIYHKGAAITANVIKAGDIATFIYSSQYHLIAINRVYTETGSTYEPIYINANHMPAKCSSPSAIVNLASDDRGGLFTAQPSLGVTGTLPVSHGGTGKNTLESGKALIGDGTNAVTLRAITNNTSATAVTANTNLITANTLYYHKGNSNLVTVGTITSGTWKGTTVGVSYGGTGADTFSSDYVLTGNGTDPIKSTNLKMTGTASLIESSTVADVKHQVTNSNGSVSLWASTNRGVRDETSGVWIIASNQAGTATYVDRWKSTGSDSQPVYFNSTGSPVAVDSQATSNAFLNALSTGSSNPQDGDYFISQYAGGGPGGTNTAVTDANKFYRRPVSALYNYIVGKADNRYVNLTDAQTVAGVKTFTSNPIISNSDPRVRATDGLASIWMGMAKGTSSSGAEYYNAGIYDVVGERYIIRGLLNATTGAVDSVAIGPWGSNGSTYVPVYFNSSGAPTACTSPSMLTNLGSTTAANVFAASPRPGITGTLSVSHGGTGATSLTSGYALIGKGTSAIEASNLSISSYHTTFSASDTTGTYYRAGNSNGAVSLYVSSNRGLYDSTNSAWMIYRATGTTTTVIPGTVELTGTVKVDSGKGSRLTVTTPSKTLWFGGNSDDSAWGIYNSTNTQYLVYQNSDGIFLNGKANALKLDNAIGGSSTPVYFNASGKPVACSKDIPTVYTASECATYTSDSGTCTPAAVKKAVTSFAVLTDATTQTILGHKTFTGDLDFLPSTPGTGTIGSLDNPAAYLTAEAVRCTYAGHGTNYARLAVYANGTTSEVGNGRLYVGNNTSSGTKGNARGSICMYGQTTGYCVITAYDTYIAFSFGGV